MSGIGTGTRGDRKTTGGPQQQAYETERRNNAISTPMPLLRRAIVTEVFFDPVIQLTPEVQERLSDDVINPSLVSQIRRNCILAKQVSTGFDRVDSQTQIYFPLLDPYLGLPLKVGEQVFTLMADPAVYPAEIGFWLCRIPEIVSVDDINYTHGDRRYANNDTTLDAIDKLEGEQDDLPGFPNGDPGEESLTFGDPDAYERIVKRAMASKQFQPEAVPRWSKRPGDTVIQGSNNTLITLMTDRTGPATNEEEVESGRGTIYLVAGRGQTAATAANEVENTRETMEVDKTPGFRKKENVPTEGDPDFENDNAIFYMSQKTSVDENFKIDISNGGEATPGDKPAIALKTDQLRLVGREDVKIQAGDNESGAAIVLKANGDIVLIPGPTGVIKLGGDDSDHGVLGHTNGSPVPGTVIGVPILTTAGGVAGTPGDDPHGKFGTKVLFKA